MCATAEIGLGLTGFGVFFTILGMLMLFDRGLIAMGNVSGWQCQEDGLPFLVYEQRLLMVSGSVSIEPCSENHTLLISDADECGVSVF